MSNNTKKLFWTHQTNMFLCKWTYKQKGSLKSGGLITERGVKFLFGLSQKAKRGVRTWAIFSCSWQEPESHFRFFKNLKGCYLIKTEKQDLSKKKSHHKICFCLWWLKRPEIHLPRLLNSLHPPELNMVFPLSILRCITFPYMFLIILLDIS